MWFDILLGTGGLVTGFCFYKAYRTFFPAKVIAAPPPDPSDVLADLVILRIQADPASVEYEHDWDAQYKHHYHKFVWSDWDAKLVLVVVPHNPWKADVSHISMGEVRRFAHNNLSIEVSHTAGKRLLAAVDQAYKWQQRKLASEQKFRNEMRACDAVEALTVKRTLT